MNKKEFREEYTDEDLGYVQDFLSDYAEMLKETEPGAINTIKLLEEVAMSLPINTDEI